MADQQNVHELVTALIKDPAQPPDLTVLNGFLGPSAAADCLRLYRSIELNIWLDIPTDQIVYRSSIEPNPDNPWGEDVVWMSRLGARHLKEGTSIPGASRQVAPREPAPAAPAGGAGTVVNVNVAGGVPVLTREPSGGDDGFGGGHHTGPVRLWGQK